MFVSLTRAQHGHTTFVSSLVPRPRPAFQLLAVRKCRSNYGGSLAWRGVATRDYYGGLGVLPQKIWEFLSFLAIPSTLIGALRPCLCYEPARAQHKVTVVFTANTYTSRSGEHTDLVILKMQIAKLHSSISTPLCTFSAQFAIDNGTFGTDNFHERQHWWGTTSSC